eukprot:8976561-Heterocapsa_arctica.AAC.1
MEDERASLKAFKMGRPAKEEERNVPGTDYVTTRWLIHRKKSNGRVKARLVAQQVKWWNDGLD